jgi:two-component system KDP operon response regulator KdpE
MTANQPLIAVIEDEAPIRRFLRASLTAEGYSVQEAGSVAEGLRCVTQYRPDLVLLDLGLPDGDGLQIVKEVRGWSSLPIVVLSAHGEEKSKIAALDAGADDFLTKPFSVGELLARIRVALRHAARVNATDEAEQTVVEFGPVCVDLAARRVFRNDAEVKLTKLEFDLLAVLVRNVGKVLTHRYLLKEVWGPQAVHENHYVRVFMANLRKKLEDDPSRPQFLLTEQGVGYRLKTDQT